MTVAEFPDKPQITTANQTHQIRQGRSRFIAMAGAYSLGNFNDNLCPSYEPHLPGSFLIGDNLRA